jgi:hypothetical protein
MSIEGVTVTKIIEPQQLGVHNDKIIYICRKENLNEMFNRSHDINIIDWKMRNKVPRGETVCKKKN